MYVVFLPIDAEYLKVDGEFFFSYDEALENLDTYKLRLALLIDSAKTKEEQARLQTKIDSAVLLPKVLH